MDELKQLRQKTSAELVDELVQLDRLRLQTARNIGMYQAELQARGISIMEDRNKQYTRFYGSSGGSASVTDRQGLNILNPDRLKLCVTEGVWKKNVTETTETKYKCTADFERMLKALLPVITPLRWSWRNSWTARCISCRMQSRKSCC